MFPQFQSSYLVIKESECNCSTSNKCFCFSQNLLYIMPDDGMSCSYSIECNTSCNHKNQEIISNTYFHQNSFQLLYPHNFLNSEYFLNLWVSRLNMLTMTKLFNIHTAVIILLSSTSSQYGCYLSSS